ncbi:MAG TPA: hypothetical protein VM243_07445, partial [Phycisphaerae bacterium]|nr:hypothetical protein [Phycisphaerae bacterium]
LNRRLSPPGSCVLNFPLCYLALNYGALCYFTSGLETPLVQVAAVLYALFVLNPRRSSLQLLLAVTPLLRHELALTFALSLVWAWLRNRALPLRMALAGVLLTGSWVGFRIYYYADLFPNTFYLKNVTDVGQGLIYLRDTAGTYMLHVVLGLFCLLVLLIRRKQPPGRAADQSNHAVHRAKPKAKAHTRRRGRRRVHPTGQRPTGLTGPPAAVASLDIRIRERLVMLLLAVSIAAYVVKIGGDARHYRFLAFPFCLCVCALAGLVEHALFRFGLGAFRPGPALGGILVGLCSFSFYPPQLDGHPFFGNRKHTIVNKISDASGHRRNRRETLPPWGSGAQIEIKRRYEESRNAGSGRPYRGTGFSDRCESIYEFFDRRVVHALGLTEPILARVQMKSDRPAHKYGLIPLGQDIYAIVKSPEIVFGRGMYRSAVDQGMAPPWIANNLDIIEVLEQKMFNTHDPAENLRLAFTFPQRIRPPAKP